MSVFGDYARYYDLLYRDKDYGGEVDFIDSLIKKHVPGAESILELGCGTGGHAEHLARLGYTVHGVDISRDMLKMAEARHAKFAPLLQNKIHFEKADVRTLRLGRKFDVVLSLFHVVSYQTTNEDILAAFNTAREHLKKGGLFIFDCWYGPAVLTDRPEIRVRNCQDETMSITRTAEPTLHPNRNLVDVDYQILVNADGKETNFHETHRMRYLFRPEVELFLSLSKFEFLEGRQWMTGRDAGFDTWYVYFVVRSR